MQTVARKGVRGYGTWKNVRKNGLRDRASKYENRNWQEADNWALGVARGWGRERESVYLSAESAENTEVGRGAEEEKEAFCGRVML